MGKDVSKEEIIELATQARMNELRIEALVNVLAKEGVVRRKDFDEEFDALCETEDR